MYTPVRPSLRLSRPEYPFCLSCHQPTLALVTTDDSMHSPPDWTKFRLFLSRTYPLGPYLRFLVPLVGFLELRKRLISYIRYSCCNKTLCVHLPFFCLVCVHTPAYVCGCARAHARSCQPGDRLQGCHASRRYLRPETDTQIWQGSVSLHPAPSFCVGLPHRSSSSPFSFSPPSSACFASSFSFSSPSTPLATRLLPSS